MLYESNVVGTDGTVRDLQETLGTIIGAFRETFDSRDILATWTANERLKEARAVGAEAIVSACGWCTRRP